LADLRRFFAQSKKNKLGALPARISEVKIWIEQTEKNIFEKNLKNKDIFCDRPPPPTPTVDAYEAASIAIALIPGGVKVLKIFRSHLKKF
jgi:hypothetical protein